MWGRTTCSCRSEDASEFERAIPDARKVIFEDTGHVAMIERPETFNRHVMEFVGAAAASGESEAAA